MEIETIYNYKSLNVDILPELISFSKSLNIKPVTVTKKTTDTYKPKILLDNFKKYQSTETLLNKLCKTNISATFSKLSPLTPDIVSEILSYKSNTLKTECIAKLLMLSKDTDIKGFILNTLQKDFEDYEEFIKHRLTLIKEFYIGSFIPKYIFKLIVDKTIQYSLEKNSVTELLLLLKNLNDINIINDFRQPLTQLTELSTLKLKDKFSILALLE